ncbi:hypothetical protein [Ottowia thiooxydans]|uniref:hypothetical protein n=1 Tax=Ottowia thiooxydans TaxID=219182 RepID=UPI00146C2DBE|nr:hypothetical protein [Ottowia thiooxydans]
MSISNLSGLMRLVCAASVVWLVAMLAHAAHATPYACSFNSEGDGQVGGCSGFRFDLFAHSPQEAYQLYLQEGGFPNDPTAEEQKKGQRFNRPSYADPWGPQVDSGGRSSLVTEGFFIDCQYGGRRQDGTPWSKRGRVFAVTCTKEIKPVFVGFFNGVWNTRWQAVDGLDEIKTVHGRIYKNHVLSYKVLYNQTGSVSGSTGLQDLAEVFIQRDRELNGLLNQRWEYFWEMLSGTHRQDGALTQNLLSKLGHYGGGLIELVDATVENLINKVASGWAHLLSNPPTAADIIEQTRVLNAFAQDGYHLVLLGHSQGNLFLNPAYDHAKNAHPFTKVAAVHVAPASPTLRGEHLLADIDLVINGLRLHGGPNTVPPVNINIPANLLEDASGHTLVKTYLDSARAARGSIKALLGAALDQASEL